MIRSSSLQSRKTTVVEYRFHLQNMESLNRPRSAARILAEGRKGVTASATSSTRTSKFHSPSLPSSAARGQMVSVHNRVKESAPVGDAGNVTKKMTPKEYSSGWHGGQWQCDYLNNKAVFLEGKVNESRKHVTYEVDEDNAVGMDHNHRSQSPTTTALK